LTSGVSRVRSVEPFLEGLRVPDCVSGVPVIADGGESAGGNGRRSAAAAVGVWSAGLRARVAWRGDRPEEPCRAENPAQGPAGQETLCRSRRLILSRVAWP
jgi:hypothetical protein